MTEQTATPSDLQAQSKQLLSAVDFGFQVEAFIMSDIGKYLISRADEQVESAVQRLKQADAEDPKAIRFLQNEIVVAESIQYWLADAIKAGQIAQDELLDQSH